MLLHIGLRINESPKGSNTYVLLFVLPSSSRVDAVFWLMCSLYDKRFPNTSRRCFWEMCSLYDVRFPSQYRIDKDEVDDPVLRH